MVVVISLSLLDIYLPEQHFMPHLYGIWPGLTVWGTIQCWLLENNLMDQCSAEGQRLWLTVISNA